MDIKWDKKFHEQIWSFTSVILSVDWPVCGGRRLQEVLMLWLKPSASGLGSGLRGTDRKWLRLMGCVWLWARQGRLRRDGFRLFSFRISLMLVCMPENERWRTNDHLFHFHPDIKWIRLHLLLKLCWKNKCLRHRHDVLPEVNNIKDVLHKEEVAMTHRTWWHRQRAGDKCPTITAEYDCIVLVRWLMSSSNRETWKGHSNFMKLIQPAKSMEGYLLR